MAAVLSQDYEANNVFLELILPFSLYNYYVVKILTTGSFTKYIKQPSTAHFYLAQQASVMWSVAAEQR